MISNDIVDAFLARLQLRQTSERVEMARLLLDRPGLSPTEAARELERFQRGVDRRTVQRFLKIFKGAAGGVARLDAMGPRWVCWECGRAVADALDVAAVAASDIPGAVAIDFGGYCQSCAERIASETDAGTRLNGRRPTANGRIPLVPVGALYGNPSMMREIIGSTRRAAGRDHAIAVLAENPLAGPLAAREILEGELAASRSLRSIKRYTATLRRPKTRILFSSIGAIGWGCISCDVWGRLSAPRRFQELAPTGFTLTDVRSMCNDCFAIGERSCRKSDS